MLKPQRSPYANKSGYAPHVWFSLAHTLTAPVPPSLHCYMLSPASSCQPPQDCTSYCCSHAHIIRPGTCLTVRRCAALFAVQGPMGPEETSGQCQLPLPVTSYSTAFKIMFHGITFPIDFILWHTTLVTFNTFAHISLILYEFGPPLWAMNRETWQKLRRASSLSGAVHAINNHYSYLVCSDATFLV